MYTQIYQETYQAQSLRRVCNGCAFDTTDCCIRYYTVFPMVKCIDNDAKLNLGVILRLITDNNVGQSSFWCFKKIQLHPVVACWQNSVPSNRTIAETVRFWVMSTLTNDVKLHGVGKRQQSHTAIWHIKILNSGNSTYWSLLREKLICLDARHASDHVCFQERASDYMQKIKKCIVLFKLHCNKPVIHWKIGNHIKIHIKKRSIYIRQRVYKFTFMLTWLSEMLW